MITCRRATKNDVALFREVRLKALKESPEAFGSTYEASLQRDVRSWEEQLWATTSGGDRNTQFAFDDEECIGIAALYREGAAPSGEGETHGGVVLLRDPNRSLVLSSPLLLGSA